MADGASGGRWAVAWSTTQGSVCRLMRSETASQVAAATEIIPTSRTPFPRFRLRFALLPDFVQIFTWPSLRPVQSFGLGRGRVPGATLPTKSLQPLHRLSSHVLNARHNLRHTAHAHPAITLHLSLAATISFLVVADAIAIHHHYHHQQPHAQCPDPQPPPRAPRPSQQPPQHPQTQQTPPPANAPAPHPPRPSPPPLPLLKPTHGPRPKKPPSSKP